MKRKIINKKEKEELFMRICVQENMDCPLKKTSIMECIQLNKEILKLKKEIWKMILDLFKGKKKSK